MADPETTSFDHTLGMGSRFSVCVGIEADIAAGLIAVVDPSLVWAGDNHPPTGDR